MKTIFSTLVLMLVAFEANAYTCRANIQSSYGNVLETFLESSYTMEAACDNALYQCNRSLSDARSSGRYYDAFCVVENGGYPMPIPAPRPPEPPRRPIPGPRPPMPIPTKVESCEAQRFDPAGMFIQAYYNTAQGPYNTDVLRIACDRSMYQCQRELRGRQFCRIVR